MGMDVMVRWNGSINNRTRQAAAVGLNAAAEELLASSQEIAPVDTGDLRRSGSVQEATIWDLTAWVVFNVSYAVIVHEGTHMNFSTVRNPQAQAKFLETPLVRDKDQLVGIVAAAIRRAYA
jgi:hypothetical protein